MHKVNSNGSSHSWRLAAESASGSAAGSGADNALAEARHQLSCWEQDVMALQFVAEHESYDDIADLEMTYNNSHLEVRMPVPSSLKQWPLDL